MVHAVLQNADEVHIGAMAKPYDEQLRLWYANGWIAGDDADSLHALVARRSNTPASEKPASEKPAERKATSSRPEANDHAVATFLGAAFALYLLALPAFFAGAAVVWIWTTIAQWAQYIMLLLCGVFFLVLAAGALPSRWRRPSVVTVCYLLAIATVPTVAGTAAYNAGWSSTAVRATACIAGVVIIGFALWVWRSARQGTWNSRFLPKRWEREVLVLVAVAIAVLGALAQAEPPSFPSLQREPDETVSGQLAIKRSYGEQACVEVAPAGGGPSSIVRCEDGGGYIEGFDWTSDGNLAVRLHFYSGRDPNELTEFYNTSNGALLRTEVGFVPIIVGRGRFSPARVASGDGGQTLILGGRGGEAFVSLRRGTTETELVRVRGARDYSFEEVGWSPDGRWAFVHDSEERVVLVDVSGEKPPRLMYDNVADLVWHQELDR